MLDLLTVENLIAFLTLTSLEVVLGIDNVIFIAILAGKLPERKRNIARQLGLAIAVVSRVLLLLAISWVMKLEEPLFALLGHEFSGQNLVVFVGGLFLLVQSTREIHHKVAGHEAEDVAASGATTLAAMLAQVAAMDVVFSLDSVITAVGMSKNIPVMIAAVMAAVAVMLIFSGGILRFVDRHPAIKLLALSFLLLIGVLLVAEGFDQHIPKGYVYFAMAFSLGVELLQMRAELNAARQSASAMPPGET